MEQARNLYVSGGVIRVPPSRRPTLARERRMTGRTMVDENGKPCSFAEYEIAQKLKQLLVCKGHGIKVRATSPQLTEQYMQSRAQLHQLKNSYQSHNTVPCAN